MSDLIKSLNEAHLFLIPFIALVIGLMGSLHCTTMCGGIILASTQGKKSALVYHFGRLLGYLLVMSLLYFLGKSTFHLFIPKISFWAEVLVGVTLILVGFSFIIGSRLAIKIPFLQKISKGLMSSSFKQKNVFFRAGLVGFSSAFLPCGQLYLLLFSLLALNSFNIALLALTFFWLGTLPALVYGMNFVKKIFQTNDRKKAILVGSLFVMIGALSLIKRPAMKDFIGQNKETQGHQCH